MGWIGLCMKNVWRIVWNGSSVLFWHDVCIGNKHFKISLFLACKSCLISKVGTRVEECGSGLLLGGGTCILEKVFFLKKSNSYSGWILSIGNEK